MSKLLHEFVSGERRAYRIALGRVYASSLSGFIAGAAVASIVFLAGIFISTYFLN